jgi:ribosomal protein S21
MGSTIEVVDNQLEVALEALKKQSLRDGTFREMNRGAAYQKHHQAMRRREGDER